MYVCLSHRSFVCVDCEVMFINQERPVGFYSVVMSEALRAGKLICFE
jgi:hypothetical protein